jgi:hypothetical protein
MLMQRCQLALVTTAVLAIGTSAALANCSEELAMLTEGMTKDGSMAPLAGEAAPTPQTGGDGMAAEPVPSGDGIAKDGSTAPLASDTSVATSVEDAQAQQEGGATAAEQAAGESSGGDAGQRDAALEEAHAALAAGDETACMSAVERAKGL